MKEVSAIYPFTQKGKALTVRQEELLEQMQTNLSPKEIAYKLHVVLRTVKHHSSQIYAKLGVSCRTELQEFMHQKKRDESLSDWKRLTPLQRNIVRIFVQDGLSKSVLSTIRGLSKNALNIELRVIYQLLKVAGTIQLVAFFFKKQLDNEALE